MSYAGVYTPQAMSHSISSRSGYPTPRTPGPRTPGPGYDDYSQYPYGEPVYDEADYAGYEDDVSATFSIRLGLL